MRHRKLRTRINRPTGPRTALMRNLAYALILNERIKTTKTKAKALRGYIEKIITWGKEGTLATRRLALSTLPHKDAVHKVFQEIAPLFKEQAGGYTRIIPEECRKGDSAEMVLIEFVKRTESYHKTQEEKKARREKRKEKARKLKRPKM